MMNRWIVAPIAAGCLVLAACDADGDWYDDDTGQPMPRTVIYQWEGQGATFFDGRETVERETPIGHGTAPCGDSAR